MYHGEALREIRDESIVHLQCCNRSEKGGSQTIGHCHYDGAGRQRTTFQILCIGLIQRISVTNTQANRVHMERSLDLAK